MRRGESRCRSGFVRILLGVACLGLLPLQHSILLPSAHAFGNQACNTNAPTPDDNDDDVDEGGCFSYQPDPPANYGSSCGGDANAGSLTCGNPINFGTGNKYQSELDYQGVGPFPLVLVRHYNSQDSGGTTLGPNWRGAYRRLLGSLYAAPAKVTRDDGRVLTFTYTWVSPPAWIPNLSVNSRLIQIPSSSVIYLTAQDEQETYSYGQLATVTNRAGQVQTLSYDSTHNLLLTVTDPFGRQVNFSYYDNGLLRQMVTPDQGIYTYVYDANSNLTSVTYPDHTSRWYFYENPTYLHALTGIQDENGKRYATFDYVDPQGRATSTQHAGGVDRFSVDYSNMSIYGLIYVTNPLLGVNKYAIEKINGFAQQDVMTRQCANCLGNSANGKLITYFDNHGNLTKRVDFNGNTTIYTYDLNRNLETQRVEASGKPEVRTISTQWHPYWRLPAKVAEPLKLTTYVYNGDGGTLCAPAAATVPKITGGTQPIGVLCQKIEQATTDANGSLGVGATLTGTPRIWSYTYNQYGQVLTVDGPRTDVVDVTTYTYYADTTASHTLGDLWTVQDAAGHITTYTSYDANGRPLTILDPNSTPITLSYDPRGRLKTMQVGNETTAYQYDNVGQLKRRTQPDGSFLAYTYDDAHRLTDIGDSLGNTIHYTLDNAGNRIQEDIKDAGGNPIKSLSRAYDELGHLSSLAGVGAP